MKDIRHVKRYDYGLWLFIENEVFNQKYKKKVLKGNDLLIQQGTRELKEELVGCFVIKKSNFGEQFTQIKVAHTEKLSSQIKLEVSTACQRPVVPQLFKRVFLYNHKKPARLKSC